MFKDTMKHGMNLKNFGIGSVFRAEGKEWLLIGDSKLGSVGVLSLGSMRLLDIRFAVSDIHYLTENEATSVARLICESIGYSPQDIDYDPAGLKTVVDNQND